MIVLGIIIFIVLEMAWCFIWRIEKGGYDGIDFLCGCFIAFIVVPFISVIIFLLISFLAHFIGLWLIPIVLFMLVILSIVYKEEISDFIAVYKEQQICNILLYSL